MTFDICDLSKTVVCDTNKTSASTFECFLLTPCTCICWEFSINPGLNCHPLLVVWQQRGLEDFGGEDFGGERKHYLCLQSRSYLCHSAMSHILCAYSFTTNVAVEAPLASLDVPCKCWLLVSFVFPNTIPSCPWNVWKFLFPIFHNPIPASAFFFFFALELNHGLSV